MRAMMFALSSSVSYESMTKAAMYFRPSGRITRPASLSAVFIPSALRSEEPVLCLLRFWLATYLSVCWHRFRSIYHGLPQEVFQLLVGEQLFSSAVLSSRTIAEGVLQLRYTASKLECMPSSVSERGVEGVDTQPVDIVIDMFDASCIFYQDVAGIVVALGNAVLHQFLSVIVKSWSKLLPQGL